LKVRFTKRIAMKQRNDISELSFEFSELLKEKSKYMIARQVLTSGTSIGANLREAQNCERRADFIHKLKIFHKEAEGTEHWLLPWRNGSILSFSGPRGKDIVLSYSKLLGKIISTTRSNLKQP